MERNLVQDVMEVYLESKDIVLKFVILGDAPRITTHKHEFNSSLFKEILNKVATLDYSAVDFEIEYRKIGQIIYNFLFFDSNGNLLADIDNILFQRTNPIVVFCKDMLGNLPFEAICKDNKLLRELRSVSRDIELELSTTRYNNKEHNQISMMILADPNEDSINSHKEGFELFTAISKLHDKVSIDFISKPLGKIEFVNILEDYDIVHFIGHGSSAAIDTEEYGGVTIGEDLFTGKDIKTLGNPPSLVFLNSCKSATLSHTMQLSITIKLLQLGVKNVVASVWSVPDIDFHPFTLDFYKLYFFGESTSYSLHRSISQSILQGNLKPNIFSLYGNGNHTIKIA